MSKSNRAVASSATVPADDFPPELRDAVWEKAQPIPGWDEDCRTDLEGNPLFRPHYRNAESGVGWEIGYIVDPAQGGAEDLSNLCVRRVQR